MIEKLIQLEKKYGGVKKGIPRRKVSPLDPRNPEKIQNGGMLGGNRMDPDEHNYSPHYARYLEKKIDQDKPLVLIELGVLCGTGLAIWADLLPKGSRIIGLDIDLSHFSDNRENLENAGAFQKNAVEVHEFDQFIDNTEYLCHILRGDLVDIVADDGVHFHNAILQSMINLYPYLEKDFVYFVEDNRTVFRKIMAAFPKLTVDRQGYMSIITGPTFKQWISRATGYEINYLIPKTYNEKINHKKLFDRNPLLPLTADKYRAREWVADQLGTDAVLKPLLYVTDNPDDIPWEDLPADFVVKPNHLSGAYRIIRDGNIDRDDILTACKNWLSRQYAPFSMEWAYLPIKPVILIEQLLDNRPESYKFHTFHGKVKFVKVISGGIEAKKNRCFTFFDPVTWEKIPVKWDIYGHEDIPRPAQLDQMIEYAEKLAAPFDYVRVDFALSGDQIYFEEMTHYPTGGHSTLDPVSFDRAWGDLWTVTPHYWERKK